MKLGQSASFPGFLRCGENDWELNWKLLTGKNVLL